MENTNKPEDILTTVEAYLVDNEWHFEKLDEMDVIQCGVKGENASFRLLFIAKEEKDLFILYVISPNNIPENRRKDIAEYLTRINYGLGVGNFEMDMDDGEVRYKIGIDIEGSYLSHVMIDNFISGSIMAMDKYYPGMMSISFAGISPKEAIETIKVDTQTVN